MVESSMAARMPGAASSANKNKRKAKADDISEKDEFHLPQIVSVNRFCGHIHAHYHLLTI